MKKNGIKKESSKWVFLAGVPLLFIALLFYQLTSAWWSYYKYPAIGSHVDIGGYNLHLYAAGESRGLPTVVLESGLPTPSSYADWKPVHEYLSIYTRVITYDRAGYGWSDAALNERTGKRLAEDLHRMLLEAGEEGPFILVGHSFGGFITKLFANNYPDDTAGMILIDSSSPDLSPPVSMSGLRLQKLLRQMGLLRLLGNTGVLPFPEAIMSNHQSREFLYRGYNNADQISEFLHMGTISAEQVKEIYENGLGSLPLVIISSPEKKQDYPDWLEKQAEMTALSTDSRHIIVEDSGHFVHFEKSQLVIDTVLELLQQ